MDDQTPDKSATGAAQDKRAEQLRRAFQRELRRMPTTYQKALIKRAVTLTVRAELCAANPASDENSIVRMDNKAKQARAEMFAAFAAKTERKATLDDYLAERAAEDVPA